MIQKNMLEAKAHLSALVNAALRGEKVYICKAGKPEVQLVPVEQAQLADEELFAPIPELQFNASVSAIHGSLDPEDLGDMI